MDTPLFQRCTLCGQQDRIGGGGLCSFCTHVLREPPPTLFAGSPDAPKILRPTQRTDWSEKALTRGFSAKVEQETRPQGACLYCGSTADLGARVEIRGAGGSAQRVRFFTTSCCSDFEGAIEKILREAEEKVEFMQALQGQVEEDKGP